MKNVRNFFAMNPVATGNENASKKYDKARGKCIMLLRIALSAKRTETK